MLLWAKGKITFWSSFEDFSWLHPRFVDRLLALFHRFDAAEAAIIAGFDHPTLAEIHRREPSWPIQMIYNARLTDPAGAASRLRRRLRLSGARILRSGRCGQPA